MKRPATGKSNFTIAYFPKSTGRWIGKDLPACQSLAEELWAEELRGGRLRFEYLDPRQLLKHALGPATQLGNGFRLCYLYYDWPGNGMDAHRREIDFFDECVGDEIRFKTLTYQAVFERLRESGQASSIPGLPGDQVLHANGGPLASEVPCHDRFGP